MIVDENGNRISALPLSDAPAQTKAFQLSIQCFDGFQLSAAFDPASGDDPAVRFWAKAAIGDAFQNIHTSPLDLSPYNGTTRTIYFECRAAGGAIKRGSVVNLTVDLPG